MSFLSHFPKGVHYYLVRLFEDAFDNGFYRPQTKYRKRATNLTEMLENLEADLEVRSRAGTDLGMREHILDSDLEDERERFARAIHKRMLRRIERAGKLDDQIRERKSDDAKRKAMEKKPVSEGQLNYLKNLGFTGLVANSWEASQKIDELQRA